jgi:ABC-type sugar transport system substrate-binding protein
MENEEITILPIENIETIYQQDKAMIDIQISTAKAYPRNIKRATENAIAIVTMDKETAATCTYSVPRGGKAITGASVHLAKILAQVWGNMRVEAKVISVEAKHVTSQAIAFDLENNLAIKVEVKRSIMGKTGRFNDDMIVVTGNAANSIALRNAVLSVIPRAIVDKIYNEAKKTITGDISDTTKFLKRR